MGEGRGTLLRAFVLATFINYTGQNLCVCATYNLKNVRLSECRTGLKHYVEQ